MNKINDHVYEPEAQRDFCVHCGCPKFEHVLFGQKKSPIVCQHQQLKRKCYTCEMEDDISCFLELIYNMNKCPSPVSKGEEAYKKLIKFAEIFPWWREKESKKQTTSGSE